MKKNNNTFVNKYMQIAINEANKGIKMETDGEKQEIPVGCVIVDNRSGKIIAKSYNKTIKNTNPLQHSEIICMNKAIKKLKTNRLENCSIFITLEPCIMCTSAIMLAKISKVYIGCLSEKTGAIISNIKLFNQKISNHKPEIYYPVMEKECEEIIKNFFKKRR